MAAAACLQEGVDLNAVRARERKQEAEEVMVQVVLIDFCELISAVNHACVALTSWP